MAMNSGPGPSLLNGSCAPSAIGTVEVERGEPGRLAPGAGRPVRPRPIVIGHAARRAAAGQLEGPIHRHSLTASNHCADCAAQSLAPCGDDNTISARSACRVGSVANVQFRCARAARTSCAQTAARRVLDGTGSTAVMELAASAAPDAIVIDAQHGLWDRQNARARGRPRLQSRAGAGAHHGRERDRDQPGARHRRRRRHRSVDRNRHPGRRRGCGGALSAARRALRRRRAAAGAGLRALLRGRERPHRGRRDDRDAARRAQRGRDRQHQGHRLRADRHRRSRDLARRLSERRCAPRAGLQGGVRRLQGGRRAVRHLHACRPRRPRSAATRAMRS